MVRYTYDDLCGLVGECPAEKQEVRVQCPWWNKCLHDLQIIVSGLGIVVHTILPVEWG